LRIELETAVEAAVAAGEVLRENFGGRQNVTYKGEVDLVTEVDGEAEKVVLEVLRGAFPDYGVLAEEGGEMAGESELRWIIDPLDGTTNYAHGFPPAFAVSIALERAGEVLIGVVHDPISEETCVDERGGGATLNGRTLWVSGTEELLRSLLATGFPYDRSDMPEALELFGRFSKLTQGMRRLGAAALDLCYVAAGRLDGYYESGVKA
jgi:myo-inositol-1(or 4)-monophosphatase